MYTISTYSPTETGCGAASAASAASRYHTAVVYLTAEKQKYEEEIERINKALVILGYVG